MKTIKLQSAENIIHKNDKYSKASSSLFEYNLHAKHNPSTIIADAGDLIIFDPDGFHRGGIIMEGQQRKVIRGQSHPIPNRGYTARFFDTHWWLQSPLNLMKFLKNSAIRNIPNKRLTRANTRG